MQKDTVKKIIEDSLEEYPALFLIDFHMGGDNQIKVVLDGDHPVSVKDCIAISRAVEGQLDREVEDFSLEVTSCGIAAPLVMPRQFKKNIGRKLAIKSAGKKIKADLISADEEGVELKWKEREPKPVGKGKHTVTKQVKLNYNEIEEAKVVITFN